MKALLAASAAVALTAGTAFAADGAKIGIIFGFTGPIESLTPPMAAGAELAIAEVNASGKLLGGTMVEAVRADSTCVDAAAATAAAERLVADGVAGIVGADCSGVTAAVVNNVSVPNGVVTISPSATSPALTTIEDKGLFFRTAPSDARQGDVLASIAKERGIETVAITYTNNDYGKGFADAFQAAFEGLGGKVTLVAAHEDGKGDYSAEVAALAASGADDLVVLGYVDQGGKGIIQGALDTDAFERFVLGDGMVGQSLVDDLGADLQGTFGTIPGATGEGAAKFEELFATQSVEGDGPYRGESYDAAALIMLAMQASGSTDRAGLAGKIMEIANAPGEKVGVGELDRALELIAAGTDIDYVGATDVEFTEVGEAAGTYLLREVEGEAFVNKGSY